MQCVQMPRNTLSRRNNARRYNSRRRRKKYHIMPLFLILLTKESRWRLPTSTSSHSSCGSHPSSQSLVRSNSNDEGMPLPTGANGGSSALAVSIKSRKASLARARSSVEKLEAGSLPEFPEANDIPRGKKLNTRCPASQHSTSPT